jgi:hypothetical protein
MIDVPKSAFDAIVLVAPETWLLGGYIASLLFIKTHRLLGLRSTNATRLLALSQQPNMAFLDSSPPYTPDPIRSFTTTPTSSQGSDNSSSSESDQTAHAPPSSPPDNNSDAKSNTDAKSSSQSSGIPSDVFDDSTEVGSDSSGSSAPNSQDDGYRINPWLYHVMHRDLENRNSPDWEPEGDAGDQDDPIEEWVDEKEQKGKEEQG